MCRLDLIIPNEQHFYVRGTSPAERQQWLVALGSAKACLTDAKQQLKGSLNCTSCKGQGKQRYQGSEYFYFLFGRIHKTGCNAKNFLSMSGAVVRT